MSKCKCKNYLRLDLDTTQFSPIARPLTFECKNTNRAEETSPPPDYERAFVMPSDLRERVERSGADPTVAQKDTLHRPLTEFAETGKVSRGGAARRRI